MKRRAETTGRCGYRRATLVVLSLCAASPAFGQNGGSGGTTPNTRDAAPASLTPASPGPEQPSAPLPPVDVVVLGKTEAQRLKGSAEAVQVVELGRAQRESADLGEVLRRSQGIGVQRSGGLGSEMRFSLNGMTDDQVRFFVDGIPLEFTGFLNVSVVPVNLVDRVEVYRGVVPVRFGVDALGGAVNLVTEGGERGTRAILSYQGGSFGTSRSVAFARHRFENTPFVVGVSAFHDYAENDYKIDVEVPNEVGRPEPARVYRFHDAYRAFGGSAEVGLVGLPWAQRLALRVYAADTFKEHQHNAVMTVPYGEVESSERVVGGTLRYAQPLRIVPGLRLDAVAAYARRSIGFEDRGRWTYDWFGRRLREKLDPGEIEDAEDTTFVEHRALGRAGLTYLLAPDHQLRLVATYERSSRSGRNELYESDVYLDPKSAEQRLETLVSGLEYELDAFSDTFENIAFVKHYRYELAAEHGRDFGNAPIDEGFATLRNRSRKLGAGNVGRLRFTPWLLAKVSYEYAFRLPDSEEVFGDGRFVLSNYELEPESSHNANLGVAVEDATLADHALRGELNVFLRDTNQLIHALPFAIDFVRHHNVWSARTKGVEAAAGWTSPGEYLWLDGNLTWLDQLNTSSRGPFADFEGDRIPNRPWFYANASARAQVSGIAARNDELSFTWYTSYVKSFYRSWESVGRSEYKLVIDAQLLHSAALTYLLKGPRTVGSTFEVQNLTDERAYDVLGVQKAGRAFYFKATLELDSDRR